MVAGRASSGQCRPDLHEQVSTWENLSKGRQEIAELIEKLIAP